MTLNNIDVTTLVLDMYVNVESAVDSNTLIISAFGGLLQLFGERIVLDDTLIGNYELPMNKKVRLTVTIEKGSGVVVVYIDGEQVLDKKGDPIRDFKAEAPVLELGNSNFKGKLCNIQIWSSIAEPNFLSSLFSNKAHVPPGDILGSPIMSKVQVTNGAAKDEAMHIGW